VQTGQRNHVVQVGVKNSSKASLTLYLEPWGEVYAIAPEATYDVVARGPEGGSVQIEVVADGIVVHAWCGSTVSLYQGETIIAECLIPVPPTPFA